MKPAAKLKPLQIFRPGRHTPVKGDAVAFSEADLRQACAAYDPALHRAPIVIGHPKSDDPAWGHIDRLAYADDAQRVVAHPTEVDPAFAEWVASGKLLSVSAMWYTPTAPNNPVPGSYYLRHVGFLGAQPPAVKGLERPAVAFAEGDEEGCIEFSEDAAAFGDWAGEQTAGLFARLRDWLISSIGLEKADAVLPSWAIDSLKREAITAPSPTPPATAGLSFGDPPVSDKTQEQLAAQAAQLEAERAALAQREAAITTREREQRRAGLVSFADGLVQEGRLLPGERAGLVELMTSLPDTGAAGTELAFAEADGTAVKKAPLQVLQGFLQGLPPRVDFTERAGNRGKATTGGVDVEDGAAIAQAALAFQDEEAKAGRTVTLEAAVQHVVDTHKEAA